MTFRVTFRFGAFELDVQAGELRRDGVLIPLQPKPFALLVLLITERERIVPLEEIFDTLWPDTAVTPSSLTRAMSHARRAIGDTHQGSILRSFPRRGYRFCAEVRVVQPGEESTLQPRARAAGERSPFVGREGALSRLERAWSRATSGTSGIVLVSGPAGIGKTRLTEVFARGVAQHGGLVCTGRARDGEGVPAFWIFVQILRSLLAERSLAAEVRALEGHARPLSGLLPELADEQLGEPGADAEGSRFRFFDAVVRVLAGSARHRPLLLVLEDLQWAGLASLRLLEHLVFELASEPVLMVATLRDAPRERGHPLNATLATLRALDRCDQIELGRLSSAEVAILLREVVGRPVPPDFAAELLARTEGVPLFLREALRVLEESGALLQPERIPRSGLLLGGRALDLIHRSFDGLSERCAELVGAGAVLGREFSLPLVAGTAEFERNEAAERLDEAVQAGLLEEDGLASYRFAHALHQELAYASLARGRRARLHLRAAELLERQCGGDFERIAAELADHHHRALAVGNTERAFALAVCAAERAARLFAYEQAATHYEQAAAALEHCASIDSRLWLSTQLSLGEAYRLSGDRPRRREVFGRALERARTLRLPHEFARAAIGFCDISEWSPHDAVAQSALREALEGLDRDEKLLRAGLLSRLAYLEMFESDGAQPLARQAVEVARKAREAGPLQDALYTLHYTLSGPDHLAERDALAREVAALARQSGPRNVAVIVLIDSACDSIMEGDAERARARRDEAAAAAGDVPTLVMTWHLRVYDAGLALLEGRFDAARDLSEEAHLLGQRIAHPYARGSFNAQGMGLARERGGFAEVIARLEPALDAFERGGLTVPEVWIRAILARAHLALGRSAEAVTRFEQIATRALEVPRDLRWLVSLIEVAHLCADLEDRTRAGPLCALLEPVEHCQGVLLAPICYGGPVAHALARLLELLDRCGEADELYATALASATRLRAAPTRARILADHARLLAKRHPHRAAALAAESRDLARSLGLGGLAV